MPISYLHSWFSFPVVGRLKGQAGWCIPTQYVTILDLSSVLLRVFNISINRVPKFLEIFINKYLHIMMDYITYLYIE